MTSAPALTAARKGASSRRIYGLDVLRGIAIFLVLLRHAWPEVFGGAGIVGVVMFFALSGYLITGLLDRDIREFGRVRYGRFYTHRAFRLIPALVFMLAGFAVIEGVWNILGDRGEIVRSVIVGMTYTMNIPGFDHGSDALSHLWTLATEEQFYLVWPVVLLLAVKWRRVRSVLIVCMVGVTALCAATIVVASPDVAKVYSLPTSWCVAMLIGSLAYLERNKVSTLLRVGQPVGRAVSWLALGVLMVISVLPEMKSWPALYLVGGPLIASLTVVLIFDYSRHTGVPKAAVRPLLGLGYISYAAYLWNYPIATWMGDRPLSLLQGTATIVLTLAVATVSWWLVEKPATNYRKRLDRGRAKPSASARG